ncbi:Peptide chain release factor [Dillenia turbinata]|uniref:Peptide chain release factor n=1 Tax=Dillenia turbinata TaxID=194707 RepID=A0AAN8W4F0_9MAGN
MVKCPDDKDMYDMAAEELEQAMVDEKRLQSLLLRSLLPKDVADERDCILEVRAGTRGEEASLFAMDTFKMYERYSQKGWKFEVVDITEPDIKGFKARSSLESIQRLPPKSVFKHEASEAISVVHMGSLNLIVGFTGCRFRVPVTNKSGRVHTSAVSCYSSSG